MRPAPTPAPAPVLCDSYLTPAALPMTPWDYYRRRRLLARLTIAEVARPHWHRPEHRESCERSVALIEQPRVVLKPYSRDSLARGLPIDPDVYYQLAEPEIFHPTLCRCCGSTEADPRITRSGDWAKLDEERICAACREEIDAADRRGVAA